MKLIFFEAKEKMDNLKNELTDRIEVDSWKIEGLFKKKLIVYGHNSDGLIMIINDYNTGKVIKERDVTPRHLHFLDRPLEEFLEAGHISKEDYTDRKRITFVDSVGIKQGLFSDKKKVVVRGFNSYYFDRIKSVHDFDTGKVLKENYSEPIC